ncbi:electron carrier [Aspergillus melleus]|uniref:Electron carrier n=1 Tax=Aspergillus melleus TaxID=138277 RepID=A0ACC3AUH6_9EURO|nr:electron carrier [Aspergillus melleus]
MAVTLDMADDFNPSPAPTKPIVTQNQTRSLLLAPPSIAAHEEKLRDLFTTFDRTTTDLQMLDRLSAGFVPLPADTYDLVLVLTDANGARRDEALRLLTRDVYTALVPAMKAGGKLQLQAGSLGANEGLEAILAGLVEKDGGFEKQVFQSVAVPLKLGGGKKKAKKETAPATNGASNGISNGINGVHSNGVGFTNGTNGVGFVDGDELIDEDDLLSEDDMKRPLQTASNCQPEKAKKRRRPCKDCTCGLAEKLDKEDQDRQEQATKDLNVLKLQADDLNDEMDFTVQGKTSSCNSCSLGDAFRCSTCPYIGLPPFKPGEEVKIMNDTIQL